MEDAPPAETPVFDRACDGCTMCCKTLRIAEINKPQNVWCHDCRIGSGCAIYPTRPRSCQTFRCTWIDGAGFVDFRPDKVKCVIYPMNDGSGLVVSVDPGRPLAYREGDFGAWIDDMSKTLPIFIVIGDKRTGLGDPARRHLDKRMGKPPEVAHVPSVFALPEGPTRKT